MPTPQPAPKAPAAPNPVPTATPTPPAPPPETEKKNSALTLILAIVISVVATAGVVGAVAYFWQQSLVLDNEEQVVQLEQQIQDLTSQVEDLTSQLEEAGEQVADEIELPAVYIGQTATMDEAEQQTLREKVIEPLIAYYNEDAVQIVSISIMPSQSETYKYSVDVAFLGDPGGHYGFLYGFEDQPLDFWTPTCKGDCEYSDAFREKYPEIVAATNSAE